MMKKYYSLFVILLVSKFVIAQVAEPVIEKAYKVETGFLCRIVDKATNQYTGDKIYHIYARSKILIKKIEDNNIIVKIIIGYIPPNKQENEPYAKKGELYCIDKSDYLLYVKLATTQIGLDLGILAVPFKFEASSFKVFPGGNISGYLGPSITFPKSKDFHITPIGFGGFSPIPLSNLTTTNSSDIKTVMGLTLGTGMILNLKAGFQLGLVSGWDFYNVDNTQKTQNWLSFSIGYQFLKKE